MALPLAEKEKRAIKKEQKRLTEIYAEVEEKKRNLVRSEEHTSELQSPR